MINPVSELKGGKTRKNHAAKSVFNTFLTEVGITPLSILIDILISRYLGPDKRGVYTFALLLLTTVSPVFIFGFDAGVRYFITKRNYEPKRVIFSVMLISFGTGTLISALYFVLWHFRLLGESGAMLDGYNIFAILAGVPFIISNLLFTRILIGDSQFSKTNLYRLLLYISQLVGYAIAIFFFHAGIGIIIGIQVFTYFTNTLRILLYLRKRYKPVAVIDKPFIKEAGKYGLKIWINDIVIISNRRLDQFIIGLWIEPKFLGFYAIAVAFSELLSILPQSVTQVFFNSVAVKSASSNMVLFTRMHRILFWSSILMALLMIITGKFLIKLFYGPAYSLSYILFVEYIPGVILYNCARLYLQYFAANGRPERNAMIQISGLLISIPLYFVLMKLIGIQGAAITSSIAYLIIYVTGFFMFRKKVTAQRLSLFILTKKDMNFFRQKATEIFPYIKGIRKRILN